MATTDDFVELDIRVGRVVEVEEFTDSFGSYCASLIGLQ